MNGERVTVTVQPYLSGAIQGRYTKIPETKLVLGKKITTKKKGYWFWKDVTYLEEDVWIISGHTFTVDSFGGWDTEIYYGCGVLKVFPFEEKEKAEEYLQILIEEGEDHG